MTIDEAKQVKKGMRHVAENERQLRVRKSYRVTEDPWVSADGTMVRFYLASMGRSWVSFEGFAIDGSKTPSSSPPERHPA